MSAWKEQQVRDRLMRYFITTDPLLITLHRPVVIETEAGGRLKTNPQELLPQMFMVYPFKRRLILEYHNNPQTLGEERTTNITWILIFNRGDNIEEGDYFEVPSDTNPPTDRLEPGRYTVTFISARLWDRGQAGIIYRGHNEDYLPSLRPPVMVSPPTVYSEMVEGLLNYSITPGEWDMGNPFATQVINWEYLDGEVWVDIVELYGVSTLVDYHPYSGMFLRVVVSMANSTGYVSAPSEPFTVAT